MCLVLIGFDTVPGYRVVLAANRDERHARPAQPLHWWPDRPLIAGGRDAVAGGTWLAVRRDGRFATVLNAPGPAATAGGPSRGDLVPAFLAGTGSVAAMERIRQRGPDYAGFHFVGGEATGAVARGWYAGRRSTQVEELGAGIHGVDSAGLGAANPRLARALEGFAQAAASGDPTSLLDLLSDTTEPGGTSGDCRPVFISDPEFGTRCSTVLRIAGDGRADMLERRFVANGLIDGETRLAWCTRALTVEPE